MVDLTMAPPHDPMPCQLSDTHARFPSSASRLLKSLGGEVQYPCVPMTSTAA